MNMLIEAAIALKDNPIEIEKLLFLAKNHIQESLLEARLSLYSLKNAENPAIIGPDAIKTLISMFSRSTGVNVILETDDIDVNIINMIITKTCIELFRKLLQMDSNMAMLL